MPYSFKPKRYDALPPNTFGVIPPKRLGAELTRTFPTATEDYAVLYARWKGAIMLYEQVSAGPVSYLPSKKRLHRHIERLGDRLIMLRESLEHFLDWSTRVRATLE